MRAVAVAFVVACYPLMELSAQQTGSNANPIVEKQVNKKGDNGKEGTIGLLDPQHWQLFVDDFAVSRGTGLDRVVHHPKAMGVVIVNDKPWETHSALPRAGFKTYVGRW
jgi:hypothetical protein